MICNHCKNKDHDTCKEENAGKTPSACDCQHRTKQTTIVLPAAVKLEIEHILAK